VTALGRRLADNLVFGADKPLLGEILCRYVVPAGRQIDDSSVRRPPTRWGDINRQFEALNRWETTVSLQSGSFWAGIAHSVPERQMIHQLVDFLTMRVHAECVNSTLRPYFGGIKVAFGGDYCRVSEDVPSGTIDFVPK
jgi:hypothetical protein